MQQISGVGVSPGRSVGPLVRMPDPISEPATGETLAEGEREAAAATVAEAAAVVKADLESRAASAAPEAKALLEATAMMAADPTLVNAAKGKVTKQARHRREPCGTPPTRWPPCWSPSAGTWPSEPATCRTCATGWSPS